MIFGGRMLLKSKAPFPQASIPKSIITSDFVFLKGAFEGKYSFLEKRILPLKKS